ncbi:MAG: ECF transporter S component [Clostridiales bacterium]|nr:ECF transporter S component [Clostridiales bacterium]
MHTHQPPDSPAEKDRPAVKSIVINGLAIALVFVAAAFIHIRIPMAGTGGMIHLGDLPLFVFALLYGRRTGTLAGALGLTLFDLLSGWTLWAPFSFVIGGSIGWTVGAVAEQNAGDKRYLYWLSILAANTVTIGGYYIAEAVLYGNWLAPAGSVPLNFLQVTVAALLAFPLAKRLKKTR